ncbi:hypothetical protein BGZ58_004992, partial [Dissophora ornata]
DVAALCCCPGTVMLLDTSHELRNAHVRVNLECHAYSVAGLSQEYGDRTVELGELLTDLRKKCSIDG